MNGLEILEVEIEDTNLFENPAFSVTKAIDKASDLFGYNILSEPFMMNLINTTWIHDPTNFQHMKVKYTFRIYFTKSNLD